MKKILITGANSYIGTSFEHYIGTHYANRYAVDTVDMIDGSWRQKDFSGYDVVCHVAGIAHQKETKQNAALYYTVNRDLAVDTAQKAKAEGVRQFVFLSSMSVYGMETGVITKDTPTVPQSHYGRAKLQAETALLALADDAFVVTVVRPPMVYGYGCRGNFQAVVKLVDKLPAFPKIESRRSMIYVDNLCAFLVMVMDESCAGVYMPQNRDYMNTSEMATWIAQAQGKNLRMSKLLSWGVKALMPFATIAQKGFGSLMYHRDLESFDFRYCGVGAEESVKMSIKNNEGITCEG